MILDDIVNDRKITYAKIMEEKPLAKVKEEALALPKGDSKFYNLFKNNDFIYICECKHKSPSKGIIKENYNYLEIAKEYELNGASAISCLTEPLYFLGSDEHLFVNYNIHISIK